MTFQVTIEVCRESDRVCVARTSPVALRSYNHGRMLRLDAKHLSMVYGKRFFVEVWAWDPAGGGLAYHRAYLMHMGRTVCAVGF